MSSRVRVYDLARELGLTSKELIALLQDQGFGVKSHSSTLEDDDADLVRDLAISNRQKSTSEESTKEQEEAPESDDGAEATEASDEQDKKIHLKAPIIVRDLADALGRKPNEIIGELMTFNVFAAINQVVEVDLVEKLCEQHGFEFVRERRREKGAKAKAKQKLTPKVAVSLKKLPRPPVVAFLGHVDHGKTSLLDFIRESQIAKGEAGGITQHIGASIIEFGGHQITFLDTPGHEAFTAMRARGANATDIVVLVVAADDGIMPQTVEAINHARAAGVTMVVAMNKMDLPGANPDKVLLGLQQNGITSEDWGGDVGVIPVSAMTGEGVSDLLDRLLLESEIMELSADPDIACEALVIDAQLESGMGPTASILVRNGTLHVGDYVLCGAHFGRAKALIDDHGKRLKTAGPSMPVKVLGLSGVPEAGDSLVSGKSEKEIKGIAQERAAETREGQLTVIRHTTLDDLFKQIEDDAVNELKLILKADVRGSIEAITDCLAKIESEKIKINVIHQGVGEITENDILLAAASDAIIVGFHVRIMPSVRQTAKNQGVEVHLYSIIYKLLEEIENAMLGRLEPEYKEIPLGEAEILQIIVTSKAGKICGCMVQSGVIRTKAQAKVFRGGELIYNGQLESLRRFKDDVKEVKNGLECGIRLDNFTDFEVGDIIKVATVEKLQAKL